MDNDYTRIAWPEVRKGDVLFHENGDRVTVRGEGERLSVAGLSLRATWQPFGFSPYRRKPELPTVPGAYLDKDGDLCVLGNEGLRSGSAHWMHFGRLVDNYVWLTDRMARARAPFTRLVPMPTEEQVREAADSGLADRSEFAATAVTNAVMALLEAGQNGEGEQ